MRIRTAAAVLALVLVLLAAGGIAYLKSIDVNQYKGVIAQAAKSATGRDLKLEGPISLALGWNPALVVEGASFANAPWGTRPEMAKLKRVEAQVELLPLIKKDVRLSRLVLVQPDILLETDRQGRGNWELGAPGSPGAGGSLPASLAVSLLIEDGRIAYRDGKTGAVHEFAIGRLTAQAKALDTPVTLDLQGAYLALPLRVKGQVGPLGRLLGAGGPFPVDIQASLAGIESTVIGQIADVQKMSGIDLRFSARSGSLDSIQVLLGKVTGLVGKFSFAAEVKGDAAAIRADNLKLTAGGTDLAGRAGVNLQGSRPRITGELKSGRLALTELLAPSGRDKAARGKPAPRKDKLFPSDPLPLGALRTLDADVRYTAGEVAAPGIRLRDLAAHVVLRDGKLAIQLLTAKVAGGTATGGLSLDAGSKDAAAGLKVKGLDTAALLKEAGQRAWMTGKADLAVDLRGRGESVAAIMASLNGETKFLMAKGTASTAGMDYAVGGFTQVLGTLLSRGRESMTLNCAASDFQVKNGVATSRALVADGEFSTIAGEGSIHLGRETIDMKVTPKPKSVTLNMSVPVKIQGTLMRPKFRPDELALARKLGGLIGVFIFPPAAIAGLGELGSWDNPCLQIMSGKGVPPAPQTSPSLTDTGKKAVEGLKKGIEGIGEGLKGLFGR